MQFRGHLLLPGDNGPGLSVNLDVAEHHLAVESDGGGLGAWPLEVVDVERLEGDTFALTVAGEPLRFVADDTIAFTYSGVPTIERVSGRSRGRSGLRSFLGRIWSAPEESAGTETDLPGRHAVSGPPDSAEAAPVNPEPTDKPKSPEESAEVTETAVEESKDPPSSIPPVEVEAEPAVVSKTVEEPVVTEEEPEDSWSSIPLVEMEPRPPATHDTVEQPAEATEGAVGEWGDAPSPVPLVEVERVAPPSPVDEVSETRCPAIRSDGLRCESPILTSSGYCYPHDPKRAFDDKYQAAQDARDQIKRDATGRLNRIYGRLDKAMRQVERGELDPETAMAMAQLARTMCAILDVEPSPLPKDNR